MPDKPDKGPYRVSFCASGGQLELIRDVVRRIRLTEDITHFSLEISSSSPVVSSSSALEGDAGDVDDDDDDDRQESGDEPDDELPETKIISSSRSEDYDEPAETGQPAHDYLESDLIDRVERSDDPLEPRAFWDWGVSKLRPDTQKWYLMGLLYREQGVLDLTGIEALLEGTEWALDYGSISAVLSQLTQRGLVERVGKGEYQLSQLGRDYMRSVVAHTKGYHLKVADEVANGPVIP